MASTFEVRINRKTHRRYKTLQKAFEGFNETIKACQSSNEACKISLIRKTGKEIKLMDFVRIK